MHAFARFRLFVHGRPSRIVTMLVVLLSLVGPALGAHRAASAQQSDAWPMSQGGNPARTRHMPGTGPAGDPVQLWSVSATAMESALGACGHQALADGVLYVTACADPGGLYAVDAATGKQLWYAPEVDGSPVIDGDGILIHSYLPEAEAFDLVRLSRADGHVVWRAEEGLIQGPWTAEVAAGVGYTPSGNELVAFDPASGARIWSAPLNAPPSRGASVDEGVIVIGDLQGTIYGFSLDGERLWTYDVEATTIGHPALANGMAYVAGNDVEPGALYALDLKTGALSWSYTTTSADVIIISPSADEHNVYASAVDGTVAALDAMTGEVRWRFAMLGPGAQSVAVVGDTAYIQGGDQYVYALDRLTGVVVYVGSCKGTLYAIGGTGA